MELNEYQKNSRNTAIYKHGLTTIDGLTYSILALCGETGELANKLKKYHRAGTLVIPPSPEQVEVLKDELGDVLWYVASVAHELGISLQDVAQFNLDKLKKRKEENKVVG